MLPDYETMELRLAHLYLEGKSMRDLSTHTIEMVNRDRAIQLMRELLITLKLHQPGDIHTEATPRRYIDALIEMTTPENFNFTVFDHDDAEGGDAGDTGIVLVRDIPFVSLCAHHLAPFEGVAHIAYIPRDAIVGLSKLARLVNFMGAGLQVQERLGQEVADYMVEQLDPKGVAVILKATHSCMSVRGAKAHGATTITSCLRGAFYDDQTARAELDTLLKL